MSETGSALAMEAVKPLAAQLDKLRSMETGEAGAYLTAARDVLAAARAPGVAALLRIRALNELGNALRINGEFPEAATVLDEVITDAAQLPAGEDRDALLAQAHLHRAIVCDLTGEIVAGVTHLDQAAVHFEALHDADGLARVSLILGALHQRIDAFSEAEAHYRRALDHYRTSGQDVRSGIVLTNLSVLLRHMGRIDEAVEAGREAVSLASGPLFEATMTGNLAFALAEAGEPEEALAMVQATEPTIMGLGDPNYIIEYQRAVAAIMLKLGRAGEARDLLLAALAEADERGYSRDTTDAHGLLSEAFAALGDYRAAYRHQKQHHQLIQAQSQKKAASQLEVYRARLELEHAQLLAEQERTARRKLAASLDELGDVHRQLAARAVKLEWSSYRDSLTELANRRYFDERLGDLSARSLEAGQDLSIMVLDLDDFKGVNDRYGHLKGDDVLRATARILQASTRKSDLVARLGGEEFAVLLTNDVHPDDLHSRAQQLRRSFQAYDWESVIPGVRPTISIGTARLSEAQGQPLRLLGLADRRLYAAKRAGRNRVISEGS